MAEGQLFGRRHIRQQVGFPFRWCQQKRTNG
jgi:hypothetical protein